MKGWAGGREAPFTLKTGKKTLQKDGRHNKVPRTIPRSAKQRCPFRCELTFDTR